MSIFKSFRSTVAPFIPRMWPNNLKLLVDPVTGAPTGIESPNASGPDGIWTPVDVTAAQLASPSAAMLADLNAVYRLNVAPYDRYHSDGTILVSDAGTNVQGPTGLFGNMIVYAPYVIDSPTGITIRGTVSVRNFPA